MGRKGEAERCSTSRLRFVVDSLSRIISGVWQLGHRITESSADECNLLLWCNRFLSILVYYRLTQCCSEMKSYFESLSPELVCAATADHLADVEGKWETYRYGWGGFCASAAVAAIRAEIALRRYLLLKTIA